MNNSEAVQKLVRESQIEPQAYESPEQFWEIVVRLKEYMEGKYAKLLSPPENGKDQDINGIDLYGTIYLLQAAYELVLNSTDEDEQNPTLREIEGQHDTLVEAFAEIRKRVPGGWTPEIRLPLIEVLQGITTSEKSKEILTNYKRLVAETWENQNRMWAAFYAESTVLKDQSSQSSGKTEFGDMSGPTLGSLY